jgi:hypothetical protein
MTHLTDATLWAGAWLTNAVPSPSPSGFGVYTGDEDLVTPGVIGRRRSGRVTAAHPRRRVVARRPPDPAAAVF